MEDWIESYDTFAMMARIAPIITSNPPMLHPMIPKNRTFLLFLDNSLYILMFLFNTPIFYKLFNDAFIKIGFVLCNGNARLSYSTVMSIRIDLKFLFNRI